MKRAPARRSRRRPPRGREAVQRALISAAARLFAERGPAAVTLRAIADEADVNHGLVHRYFGSKEALLHAALRARAATTIARLSKLQEPAALLRALRATAADPQAGWRLLSRTLLDPAIDLPSDYSFPGVSIMIRNIEKGQARGTIDPELDARVVAELALVCMLGWLQFGSFVAAATGLRERGSDGLEELAALLGRVVRDPAADPLLRDDPDSPDTQRDAPSARTSVQRGTSNSR